MRTFTIVLSLSFLLSIISLADVIYLRNGIILRGKVEKTEDNIVFFKTVLGIEKIDKTQIWRMLDDNENIIFENPANRPTTSSETSTQVPEKQPSIAPPKSQDNQKQIHPAVDQNQTLGKYKTVDAYITFALGSHTIKPTKTTVKINGMEQAEGKYSSYSGVIFLGQVIYQGSENFAVLFGGTADKYQGGAIGSYYFGGHLYLSRPPISPFLFVKVGYGSGVLDSPYTDEKPKAYGPYFAAGIGSKIYFGSSWGLFGEFGYKYQGSSAEYELEDSYGNKYKIENEQKISGYQFAIGFFFYP